MKKRNELNFWVSYTAWAVVVIVFVTSLPPVTQTWYAPSIWGAAFALIITLIMYGRPR